MDTDKTVSKKPAISSKWLPGFLLFGFVWIYSEKYQSSADPLKGLAIVVIGAFAVWLYYRWHPMKEAKNQALVGLMKGFLLLLLSAALIGMATALV